MAEVIQFRPKSAKIIRLGPLRTNDPFEGRRGFGVRRDDPSTYRLDDDPDPPEAA
jgi:hypothetical protein